MRQTNDTKSEAVNIIGQAMLTEAPVLMTYFELADIAVTNLGEAGFEIVQKPKPGSTTVDRVEFARRTGCWDGVSDRDYRTWLASLQQTIVPPAPAVAMVSRVTHEDGSVTERRSAPVETETEKAARWSSVLIAQILEDGTARQAEAGVDAAAKDALARLRRDRGRIAFEDIDRNPPTGACHASDLFAGWARSLGDKVEWCEARLLPRRLVLTVSLRREPSQEERADLDWRLKFLGQMAGVVGTSVKASVNLGTGAAQVEVEVRFAHYITTIGCEYTPGDLPARPARKAA